MMLKLLEVKIMLQTISKDQGQMFLFFSWSCSELVCFMESCNVLHCTELLFERYEHFQSYSSSLPLPKEMPTLLRHLFVPANL